MYDWQLLLPVYYIRRYDCDRWVSRESFTGRCSLFRRMSQRKWQVAARSIVVWAINAIMTNTLWIVLHNLQIWIFAFGDRRTCTFCCNEIYRNLLLCNAWHNHWNGSCEHISNVFEFMSMCSCFHTNHSAIPNAIVYYFQFHRDFACCI